MSAPHIGVIHATPLSLDPLAAALRSEFPDARVRNVLDDSLLADLQAAGRLTPALTARMERLIEHLVADDVAAVQLACSGFAPVVDDARARLAIPVLKPDEAMYRLLVEDGHAHVGIVATVQATLDFAREQVTELARRHGTAVRVSTAFRPDGMAAAQRGDHTELGRVIGAAARELESQGASAVALGQYSLSPVADAVAAEIGVPLYTGPTSAARLLRTLVAAPS